MQLPDLSNITAENIGASLGVALAALWLAFSKYRSEKKEKTENPPGATDIIVSGGTIADMGPFRSIDIKLGRTADAMEEMLVLMRKRQESEREEADKEEIDDLKRMIYSMREQLIAAGQTVPPQPRRHR